MGRQLALLAQITILLGSGAFLRPTLGQSPAAIGSSVNNSIQTFCGVPLGASAAKLLDEVQTSCDDKVQEHYWDHPTRPAEANLVDGSPRVTVNRRARLSEADIAHELFHIKFKLSGYPDVILRGDRQVIRPNSELLEGVLGRLRDSIEHYAMFPGMRESGWDPELFFRKDLSEVLRKRKFVDEPIDDVRVALKLIGFNLEVTDESLIRELDNLCLDRQWNVQMSLAKKQAQAIRAAKLQDPTAAIGVFIECANELLQGKLKLKHTDWENRPCGNRHWRYAVVWVSLP